MPRFTILSTGFFLFLLSSVQAGEIVVNHFSCKSLSGAIARYYAEDPANAPKLDALMSMLPPRRQKTPKLNSSQIATLDGLLGDLASGRLNLREFLGESYLKAVELLEKDVAEARARLHGEQGRLAFEQLEYARLNNPRFMEGSEGTPIFSAPMVTVGDWVKENSVSMQGMEPGSLVTIPGTRFHSGAMSVYTWRINTYKERIPVYEAELTQAEVRLTELKNITPEKAFQAFLIGNGLKESYDQVVAERDAAQAAEKTKADKAQAKLDKRAAREREKAESLERENQATEREAKMAWVRETLGTERTLEKAVKRLNDEDGEALSRLETALRMSDADLIQRYVDQSWNSIYSLYEAANSKLGRHNESTAAVAWYLMPESLRIQYDTNSPEFIAKVEESLMYNIIEKYTSPTGHAFQSFMHSLPDQSRLDLLAAARTTPGLDHPGYRHLRRLYYELAPHMESHAEVVGEIRARLEVPPSNVGAFDEHMRVTTIDSRSARAGRAASRTSRMAAGLLLVVGAGSTGSHLLNTQAGVTQAPTFQTQMEFVDPYLSKVLDHTEPVYDAVGEFIIESGKQAPSVFEDMGRRMSESRKPMP